MTASTTIAREFANSKMLMQFSLSFIVTSVICGLFVIIVLYCLTLKKFKSKSEVSKVWHNVTVNGRPSRKIRKQRSVRHKKKMASSAITQAMKTCKSEPITENEQPTKSASSTKALKRHSPEECKDVFNNPSNKKQSPKKSKVIRETKDFNHPVYKSISSQNGEINRMTHQQLISTLKQFNLDSSGYPDILKKRLKLYYMESSLGKAGLDSHQTAQSFDYLCVIDFEATCERQNPADYLHEIIEFPIVLVNTKTRLVEDTLMLFCKPLLNPKLSEFCTSLTNITQVQVDYADTFPVVLETVNRWMKHKELGSKYKFAIVTDGPWDMNLFLRVQCKLSKLKFPSYAKNWINLSKTFSSFYKTSRVKLELMLRNLGMEFEGQPHRGIDDAKNIARIAVKLMEDGCNLVINDALT
ncbi:3'-5' exoribonuclease 1-like [Apostichopus japonicus]|uniref:3'-5' exoribonuclease 1-like n=1 Tax=Stichopus japonicus TaxID=307972 RepID=UPI003AB4170B